MIVRALLCIAGAALAGCQSLYFYPAGEPAAPPRAHALAAWPDREYWSGVVFNGEKIGFSHLALDEAATPGLFELRSDAAFALRFLGFDKRVTLKAHDVVRDDLALVSFRYDYLIDGNAVALSGERRGDVLEVTIGHAGQTTRQSIAVSGAIYPQAAIALYPSHAGLAVGREYRYPVYSGELQKLAQVTQRVVAYERSSLFQGEAFRVETSMEGYRVETWISPRGAPLLEIGMNGVLISGLEDETRARSFLVSATLSQTEALADFALVRIDPPLASPRSITTLKVALSGATPTLPSDGLQRCERVADATVCTVSTGGAAEAGAASPSAADPRYLAATFTVPARDPRIVSLAREIVGGEDDPRARLRLVVAWIGRNVRKSPADVWTALDVLDRREAECQGHAYLYAALARALGVPTRVVNGIVYSEDLGGFFYHTWAESFVGGGWLGVDPTLGMLPADATHVTFVEGETPASLAPLADWVGRLKVRVLAVGRGG